MKLGMRSPACVDALYGSEVKFGYNKPIANKNHRYRVEGQLLTWREICERLPDVSPTLLANRLHRGQFDNTWAELSRPTNTLTQKGRAVVSQRGAKRDRAKRYRQQMAIENAARAEAQRSGHKPL